MSEYRKELTERITKALGLGSPPIAVYYTDEKPDNALGKTENDPKGHFCNITYLKAVANGKTAFVDAKNYGCGGGGYYLGFCPDLREGFEYFLSHDSEGHGERFKKTPELVRQLMTRVKPLPAPARYCVFELLERVPESITPVSVVFLVNPDELGALTFLANYGRPGNDAVIAPFCSGCGSIVHEPRLQADNPEPKAVIGLLDITVRHMIDKDILSFAIPCSMFIEMAENVEGSFLEIEPWTKLRDR